MFFARELQQRVSPFQPIAGALQEITADEPESSSGLADPDASVATRGFECCYVIFWTYCFTAT
jgi:hypothetical protein